LIYVSGEEFRQFILKPSQNFEKTGRKKPTVHMIMPKDYKRAEKIDPDNVDWKSIWPGPRTFDPNAIPIPVRQGRLKMKDRAISKYANMELMKIPAFFHLTPPAIKAHCEELKKFCTPFPPELDTKEKCEKHFPLTVITNDYLHSAPTIRDPLARIVTVKLKLKDIPLDEHARDKLMRLIKDRYDEKTDTLTIVTDRCPLRKQNYDYAQYLLTALFYESWNEEDWESSKTEADMEKYVWERNTSAKALASIINWTPDKLGKAVYHDPLPEDKLKPEHYEYGKAVKKVVEGESEEGWSQYKKAAIQVLINQ
ncbi:28S ribosomal protein S35, mitochondrial, partial [Frankliniella fusca]